MASNDSNDFWGKGTPPGPPSDPNEGFWSGAKKKDADKPQPSKGEPPKNDPPSKPAEGGFWGTGQSSISSAMGQPSPEKPEEPDAAFWNKAEERKKEAIAHAAVPEDQKKLAKKRRRRKIIWISLGSLLLLFIILIALVPTIAGMVAPRIIESEAAKQISGKVTVESTSFGWFSPQRITGLRLQDKDGKDIAKLSLEAEPGLASFATGKLDIGTVTLSGVKADLVRYADGSTNLDHAIAPKTPAKTPAKAAPGQPASSQSKAPANTPAKPAPATPASSETRIPDSLNAHLVAKNMQVTYTDLTKPAAPVSASLKSMDLDVKVAAGAPLSLVFSADAVSGAATGKLAATIKADKLIRKDGLVEPSKATIDADISAKSISLELADGFVALGGGASLQKGLGDTIDLSLKASGNLKEAKATVSATATNLSAAADLRVADNVLTTTTPIDLTIKGAAIRALVPAIDQSLAQAKDSATITALPDAHLTVQNLKVTIPTGGNLDLRGTSASIALTLSETTGTVSLPGDKPDGPGVFRPFRIAPLETHIDTTDLSKDAHITAATNATVNSQPAGNLSIDLTLVGILDANGAPVKGPPGSVQGTVAIRQIATAIAQPFVEAMKLNLPQDVGPTLDIEAHATSNLAAATAGGTPPADIAISVQSQGIKVAGAIKLSDAGIITTGDGLRIEVATLGQMAQRLVGPETGWRVSPATGTAAGGAVITVKDLNVPRGAGGAVQLDKAAGTVSVALAGLTVSPLKAQAPAPIEVKSVTIGAHLASGGTAKLDISSALAYSGANFGAHGNFDIPGLIVPSTAGAPAAPVPPMQLRPVGQLQIKDIPIALAKAILPPQAPAAPAVAQATPPANGAKPNPPAANQPQAVAQAPAPPLDLPKLLADTLGPTMTVSLNTAAAKGADAINAAITLVSANANVEVQADVGASAVALKKFTAQATATPQTVTGLMAAFAPNVAGAPKLGGPAKIVFQVDPISVPLKDFKPQLDRAGQASVKLSLPGKTVVDGLVATNADGTKRELGRVGVDSLEFAAKVPIGALVGPILPEDRKTSITLSGTVLGASNEPLLELSGQVDTLLSDSKLAGPLTASVKVTKINTGSIEDLAGQHGLLTGSLGNTAGVELSASITPPPATPGSPFDIAQATMDAEINLSAPHLHSDGPIKATLTAGAIQVVKPVRLTLDVDAAFANKFLKPVPDPKADPKAPKPVAAVLLTDPMSISVTISKLTYPRPGAAAPSMLDAGLGISIPALKLKSSDNQAIRLTTIAVQIAAEAPKTAAGAPAATNPSIPITCKLDVAEAAVGDQPAAKTLTLTASIIDLITGAAEINTKTAVINATGDLPVVPTALVDAMAKQDGALVEGLGPVVTLKLNVERYPLGDVKPGGTPPVIDVHATAARASADLRGTIRDNIFVSETPLHVTVVELTKAMSARFVKGLPVIGTVEKTKQDAPATVVGSALTVSLGNDMTKLNGDIAIDPGEARFGTSGAFASILKSIKQKDTGSLGHKLEPLNITIRKGVATYQKWNVPLGDFNIQTEGTIDLVQRQIDVITWLPFGALSDQAAGSLNTGLGSLLGKAVPSTIDAATMVPFRTKGSLDNPTTKPDLELFGKNFVKQLSPDKLKDNIGNLLKNKLGGK